MQRLQTQAEMFCAFVDDALKKMGVAPGMTVADIGCGTGEVSFLISQLVGSKGSVKGLDANPTAIEFCKKEAGRRGTRNVEFLVGDAHKMGFPSRSFDLVYSRFLLQHLKSPEACLEEMFRIAKPGSTVMVEDCDLGKWVVEPANKYVDQLWRWYGEIVSEKGSDPAIGRKLYGMFIDSGLKPQVEVYSLPISWNSRHVWDSILAVLEKIDDPSRREVIEGIRNFKERKDALFVFPIVFRVWAKVP